MKRLIIVFSLLLYAFSVFGQSTVVAEKEKLGIITTGEGQNQVSYLSTEEGFFSPGGIFVDSEGQLFFIQNFQSKPILRFREREFYQTPVPQNVPNTWFGPSSYGISQNGVSGEGSFFFTLDSKNLYKQTDFYNKAYMRPAIARWYTTPWGIVWESIDGKQLISAEFKVGASAKLRTLQETRAWLPTQPGGFSVGDDGLLYRNGVLWSAVPPKNWSGARYLGRLASGHCLWGVGTFGEESGFLISNAKSEIELEFYLPWKFENGKETLTRFNYGVGPWGELYCLIAPPWIPSGKKIKGGDGYVDEYIFDSSVPSELVVVRNHLKYFGRLNDGGVRLRKGPTTGDEIIGTYPAKTGFRILERSGKNETIAGMTSDWVKVRLLDGKEGWFFGAFVHNLYDGPNGAPPPWPNVPDW